MAEKFMKESGDKLEASDRHAIESATNDVKKALESNDGKAIARTLETLMQAQQKAGENLYKQSGAAAGPGPEGSAPGDGATSAGGNGKASDDVIDAEVVEEKRH
jgi:molecular chaperone DnaK